MRIIRKLLSSIFSILPLRKIIVFESIPDYSDNTKAVFDYMVSEHLNKKYRLVWLCYSKNSFSYIKLKNVSFIKKDSLLETYYLKRSKAVICCNHFVKPSSERQLSFYLGHGSPLKSAKGYYEIPSWFNYVFVASQNMGDILNGFYGISKEKLIALGYPRNDQLINYRFDLHNLFNVDFKKIIVWYPTFRQGKGGTTTGSKHSLPIIWNEEQALKLNECAASLSVLLVLKPHFAQDVSLIKELNLSNIIFIDDSFFEKNNISSYQFVGNCDALITDFSSIYYDFLICGKPIGLIWEDFDDYSKNPGFAVDVHYYTKAGVKILDLTGFLKFINDISLNKDILSQERKEICKLVNYSNDANNSKRVYDFIMNVIETK